MVYTDRIHLVADTLDELHSFAKQIGLKREWFQLIARHPHYDLFGVNVQKAIDNGAELAGRVKISQCNKKLRDELRELYLSEREFLYKHYPSMQKFDDDKEIKINIVTLLDILNKHKNESNSL